MHAGDWSQVLRGSSSTLNLCELSISPVPVLCFLKGNLIMPKVIPSQNRHLATLETVKTRMNRPCCVLRAPLFLAGVFVSLLVFVYSGSFSREYRCHRWEKVV